MTHFGPVDVIAIDGPSGTGKSSVARAVARELGWRYLDTGAMYRALTWAVLRAQAPVSEAAEVARRISVSIGTDSSAEDIAVDGEHVEAEIRSPEVTAAVSAVSAVPQVRSLLVEAQRSLIGDGQIVVEGRDIATVVVPDARLKIYLTADADVRAARRAREVGAQAAEVAEVANALRRRDGFDSSREASPLRPALHAVVVDTSAMSQSEVVEHIVSLARLVVS
ncbi:MAG: (d)CMP kinase [Geodermatophilaceae bacterium]|nr:(d)CMP kinase [Geodermatophilaceae bacterium]MDQ3464435.1 (d)CMP kinase [Actinomycetota bacterium]